MLELSGNTFGLGPLEEASGRPEVGSGESPLVVVSLVEQDIDQYQNPLYSEHWVSQMASGRGLVVSAELESWSSETWSLGTLVVLCSTSERK